MSEVHPIRQRNRLVGGSATEVPREQIKTVNVSSILVEDRLLSLKKDNIEALVSSIGDHGLQSPILVKVLDDRCTYRLVAGMHRLVAHERLGLPTIKAIVTTAGDVECQIMEIDENLVRSEINPLEKSRLLKTRKKLYDAKGGTTRPTPGGKQKTGFAKETAAKTGMSKRDVNRSIRRAECIAKDVQEQIAGTAIATNTAELDALAAVPPEEQRAAVERIRKGEAKNVREALRGVGPDPEEREYQKIKNLLIKASPAVRQRICGWLDESNETIKQAAQDSPEIERAVAKDSPMVPMAHEVHRGGHWPDRDPHGAAVESKKRQAVKQSQVDSAPSLELEPPPVSASSSNGSPLAKHSFSNVGRKAGIGDLDIDKIRKDEMLQLVHRHNLQIPDFEKLPIPEMRTALKELQAAKDQSGLGGPRE